jgi:hypothetical protein
MLGGDAGVTAASRKLMQTSIDYSYIKIWRCISACYKQNSHLTFIYKCTKALRNIINLQMARTRNHQIQISCKYSFCWWMYNRLILTLCPAFWSFFPSTFIYRRHYKYWIDRPYTWGGPLSIMRHRVCWGLCCIWLVYVYVFIGVVYIPFGKAAPGAGFLKFVSKSPQFDLDTLCPW